VLEHIRRAIADPADRAFVEKAAERRVMSRLAVPLKLGEQGDTHFHVTSHWRDHFTRMQARSGVTTLHVEDLRRWIDEPEPAGLPAPVANLLILAYADATNRSFFRDGEPYADARLDGLSDRLELREQELPDQAAWEAARKRAKAIFGVEVPPYRNAGNVAAMHAQVTRGVEEHFDAAHELPGLLERHWADLGSTPEQLAASNRMKTARSAAALLTALARREPTPLAKTVAAASVETSAEAVGKSLATARAVIEAMKRVEWVVFQGLTRLEDDRHDASRRILEDVRDRLGRDELALPQGIGETLRRQASEAAKLLAHSPPIVYVPPVVGPTVTGPSPGKKRITKVDAGQGQNWDAAQLHQAMEELRRRLEGEPSLKVSLSWAIFKEEDS
jgi:hypothetical protein